MRSIDPIHSLAFSIQANPGVYAHLVGSGVSRAAKIPTGWEITLDLIRRLAAVRGEECGSEPERIIQTVNRPRRSIAQSVVLSWIDTKEVRESESRMYALPNDSERKVDHTVTAALRSYDVTTVTWSERDEVRVELAA